MSLFLPLIMLGFCLAIFLVLCIMQKRINKRNQVNSLDARKQKLTKTAQQFTNVKSIEKMCLYTLDNYIITYIKIQPVTIDLLTRSEKQILARGLTNEFSQLKVPFKFIAISRPVDIAPLLTEYSDLLTNSSDPIQKELLRNEIKVITDFSLSGEVVQREFYYLLWSKVEENAEAELKKKTKELAENIEATGIKCKVLNQNEITRLCNLFDNPALATVEDINTDISVPFLKLYES